MSPRPSKNELEKLRAENSKLKAENNRLQQKTVKTMNHKKPRSPLKIIRSSAVVLLLALSVALLTTANLLFWFGNTVVKQDRFVAATQPIIKDPLVQSTMALYTTNNIFNNIDVQKITEQVLPPRADFLAPQLTNQLKGYTQTTLQKVLANPSFQDKWNAAMARQHERLISFASKYQGDGDISVNDVFNNLTGRLSNTKLAFLAGKQLPAKVGDITVISAPWLPAFHNVVVHIDTWRTIAVILLVATVTGAVWLSRRPRRTLYIFSGASALMMVATLVALVIARNMIVSKADPQYADGVRHVMQIVFHSLVIQTVTILAAVVFVWLVAWVSSPSRRAVAIKQQVTLIFSGKFHQRIFATENKFTLWVQHNKRILEWLSVAIVAAIMLLVRLTLLGLFIYALLMLVLVLAIEVIGGEASKASVTSRKAKAF